MTLAKKSFGQHFLRDATVVQAILEAARPEEFSLTVEVGPGRGALTGALVKRKKEKVKNGVVLIEADWELIPELRERFPDTHIMQADAAQVDYAAILSLCNLPLSSPWLLIGNLPYNAANAIIMWALQAPTPPARMVVMVQKEVGERLLGLEGSRGLLTVAVQLYVNIERVCTVKPGAFVPPPKVDSMVLKLSLTTEAKLDDRSFALKKEVIRIAKAGFANRRKQLHGNLADAGIADSGRTKQVLEALDLPPTARAEELSIEQWTALVERLSYGRNAFRPYRGG